MVTNFYYDQGRRRKLIMGLLSLRLIGAIGPAMVSAAGENAVCRPLWKCSLVKKKVYKMEKKVSFCLIPFIHP